MNSAYRARLESYLATMIQVKKMREMGILSVEDFSKLDTIIATKYGISTRSIYRGYDLLYARFRGNM